MANRMDLEGAIEQEVKRYTRKLLDEEIDQIVERVTRRVNEAADRLAISVLTKYDVYRNGDDVMIRVVKKGKRDD